VVWNKEEKEVYEGVKTHTSPITILQWSPCGSILVSGDTLGNLVLWDGNEQGHITPRSHHDFKDPVCQIVFRTMREDSRFVLIILGL